MESRVFIRKDGEVAATGVADALPWWSFTKTVLAIALVRLSDQGRVSLDEVVDGMPYTPAQLLRHEAGLPDYGNLAGYHAAVEARMAPWPVEELLTAVEADRLRFEPGLDWAYSNIGYMLVARLIEKISQASLADTLADLVFNPAGLATARLVVTQADLADVCMGDALGYHPGWVYHGLVVGTATDAARLLRGLLSGNLVSPASLAAMLQHRALPQFRSENHPDPAYGMGLMMRATCPLDHPVGHSGGGPGSRIAVYQQLGATCAVWADTTSGIDPEAEVFYMLGNAVD